jgi:hypothetical protein
MIKNRIKGLLQVDWRKVKDLQPKNLKQIFNYSHIEQSILKHGFAFPFGVYVDKKGDVYAIDGHTRIEVLSNMEGVPDLLPAFEIDAKSKKEAIEILLEVYNQRTNPIDEDVLRDWLEVEEIAIEEISVESLNVFGLGSGDENFEVPDYQAGNEGSSGGGEESDKLTIKLEYTAEDYEVVKDQLSRIAHTPEEAIWKLLGNS